MNSGEEGSVQVAATTSATAQFSGLRTAHIVRAGVLLAVGLAIAFTATLHEQLGFDRAVLASALGLIGVATVLEYLALRGTQESWWVAARATVAFAAAGACVAAIDSPTLALTVAIWALLTALITVMRLARRVQPSRVAVPSLLLSLALAVATLATRDDPVAVIGFFGAYAMIRGVFLGIAAFDPGTGAKAPAAQPQDGSID